jgi:hypothetical protein
LKLGGRRRVAESDTGKTGQELTLFQGLDARPEGMGMSAGLG